MQDRIKYMKALAEGVDIMKKFSNLYGGFMDMCKNIGVSININGLETTM